MSAPQSVTYQFLELDGLLENVATRYQTNIASMWSVTRAHVRRFRDVASPEAFARVVQHGDRILIPFAGDAWDWDLYMDVKETTLAEACAAKNADPAMRGGLRLTPRFLWNHVLNAELRAACVRRFPDLAEQRVLDANPDDARVRQLTLSYPRPRRVPAGPVTVAPNARNGRPTPPVQTNVSVPPRWLIDLIGKLDALDDLSSTLDSVSDACEELQKQGIREVAHGVVLHMFLEVLHRYTTGDASKNAVKALAGNVEHLHRLATEILFGNPAATVRPELDGARRFTAGKLQPGLRDPEFLALVRRGLGEPDQLINGVGLHNKIARTLNAGHEAVIRSHLADDALTDVEAAMQFLGTATGAQPHAQAPTALAAMLSLVGVTPSVFGNAPGDGPSTLSIACIKWVALKNLPLALSDNALAQAKRADIRRWLLTVARPRLTDANFAEIDVASLSGSRRDLDKVMDKALSGFQSDGAASALLLVVNLYCLYGGITSDDTLTARYWANVIGGGSSSAQAALSWIRALAPAGELYKTFRGLGTVFGGVASVCSIVSGALTFEDGWENRRNDEMVVGGLQVLGGATALAGFLLVFPPLEILGAAILVAVAVVGNWDAIKESFKSGSRRIFLAQLSFLKSQDLYARALHARPDFKRAFDAVEAAASVEDGSLADGLPDLLYTGAAERDLRALGFDSDDINLILLTPMTPMIDPF